MSAHRSSRWRVAVGLALCLLLSGVGRADEGEDGKLDDTADDKVSFADEVNRAIDEGVAWLLARPARFKSGGSKMAHFGLVDSARPYPGSEGELYKHPAGTTALALYTLLKCGVDEKHPVIKEGFNWLTVAHPTTRKYDGRTYRPSWSHSDADVPASYELSVMILALTAKYDPYKRTKNTKLLRKKGKLKIRNKKDRRLLDSWVSMLVDRRGIPVGGDPERRRGWRYNEPIFKWTPEHGNQDLSSTQLAALALFAAHQLGVTVKTRVWFDILDLTLEFQEADGPSHTLPDPMRGRSKYADPLTEPAKARGFIYLPGSPDEAEGKATGSMTACGIANILLAKSVLLEDAGARATWGSKGLQQKTLIAVRDAIAWLDKHWSPFKNPVKRTYDIYYLYALERAMDLLNKNLVGEHLWYTEGARAILDRKKPTEVAGPRKSDPKQPGVYWETKLTHRPYDVLDTCFALLFLKRATKDLVPGGVPITGGG